MKRGRRMKLRTGERLTEELVAKRHKLIVEKLFEVGFCHYMRDSLDLTLPKQLIKKSMECEQK